MKKIFLFITTLLITPLITNALVVDYNLSSEIGGFSGFMFNSPLMIALNVSAAIIMIFTIINFMVGYTRWKYLASGNVDEMKNANNTLKNGFIGLFIILIVLIIDLTIK